MTKVKINPLRNYRADSLKFREEFAKTINYSKLKFKDNFEFREELGNRENKLMEYEIRKDDRIILPKVGWAEGSIQYKFRSTIKSFSFAVNTTKNQNCGGTTIEQLKLDGGSYQRKEGYILVILPCK